MKESLHDAKNELKRVDHQIYVSLKYTRTVDVIMNTLGRMIDAYECMIDSLLKYAVSKGNLEEEQVPKTPLERGNLVKELFSDEEIVQRNIELYFLMRKIVKTAPQKEQEYRRHVTLRTFVDNQETIVDIDIATEYYNQLKEFCEWIDKNINEEDGSC